MLPSDLIGKVVATRLAEMLDPPPTSRILIGVMGLSPSVATAVAREAATLKVDGGRVDSSIDPSLVFGDPGSARLSDETATHHRNEPFADDVLLTLFCVPAAQVASVEGSLQHLERITDAWLLDDFIPWADHALPHTDDDTRQHLVHLLRGLARSEAAFDANRVAEYAVRVARHMMEDSQPFKAAVRAALPALHLPRDSGDPGANLADQAHAELFFRKVFDEARPLLHLRDKDGEPLDRVDLRKRLARLEASGEFPPETAEALRMLLADPHVGDGGWTGSQARAAELPWEDIERLFSEDRRKTKLTFGLETSQFFHARYPSALTEADRELLRDLKSETARESERFDEFFSRHRDKLRNDPKLYRRWERLVFRKPIEVNDLAEGMLRLAARLRPDNENGEGDMSLYVRLHESDGLAFWTEDKNTKICRVLRDRWRGLATLFHPWAVLDFGRCWSDDWEREAGQEWDEVSTTSKDAVLFRFEGYMVPRATVAAGAKPDATTLRAAARAQMFWKAKADAFDTAFPIDLNILAAEPGGVPLVTARVSQNQYDRHGAVQAVDLTDVGTITDVMGNSHGRMCNPNKRENRVDLAWESDLAQIEASHILTASQTDACRTAYGLFRESYGSAIRAMISGGAGLASQFLLDQAERYGELLRTLRREARAEVCVRKLWLPLLTIGTALVETARPSVIVSASHPLRLAEIGVKARQLAEAVSRVLQSPDRLADEVQDYVDATVAAMSRSYYADIGVAPGAPPTFVAESRRVSDVSLLEPPTSGATDVLADEPAEDTVDAFDRVASFYLDLRPHEKASFSAVLIDVESENLPVEMANSMARRIEADPGLRCDLVLTHDNVGSLRRIYERQNRRIGHDVDTSLTSEAARNFLSRLRVAIVNPETLEASTGKSHDIVVLQDVIARQAEVRWMPSVVASARDLSAHIPTSQSRRKPFRRGDTTSGAFLTAPGSPDAVQAYIDAIHDVRDGKASPGDDGWLPMQEVEFQSGKVREAMAKAHRLGHWVMTYDRLADRRLVSAENRRIIRYVSDPRSDHNVIVSAEITEEALRERLAGDLSAALPAESPENLRAIVRAVHAQSASLSGAIVMRGAQRQNHAQELLGLVLARSQMDLLLADKVSERVAAWFFLDDFSSWLGLSEGLRADILGVDFSVGEDGQRVRFVVGEAKFVSLDTLADQQRRSLEQLEASYTTLRKRLVSSDGTVDPSMWRGRIADLVLEHIEPFDQVGGMSFGDWIAALRSGSIPMEISGHSVVFAHDMAPEPHEQPLLVPDADEPREKRRRLAQWTFGRASVAKALRALVAAQPQHLLSIPADWPDGEAYQEAPRARSGSDTGGGGQPPDVASAGGSPIGQPLTPSLPPPPNISPETDDAKPSPPQGWLPRIHAAVFGMSHADTTEKANDWLEEQVKTLRSAIQKEGMAANIVSSRLTPNSGLVEVDGKTVTVSWLEKKQTDLLTKYGLDIIRISPKPGRIAIGIRRPKRAILHLADAWLRRSLEKTAPGAHLAFLLGEREDDGSLFYLPIGEPFGDQERAAPHTIISGTTGSGKGILATSLMLDACAFNNPARLKLQLIDPKRGVDYAWLRQMPHLKGNIIETKEDGLATFRSLVEEMERRYVAIKEAAVNNITQFNLKCADAGQMPRILVFFDEVANWMQDDDFKGHVEPLINEIATKSRAAGIHLFMVYQRADNQVMTMQLRTNLGNKLVLRLGDEGSSKIAMNERGAERLLGKGHFIAKLDSDDKVYGQVPYIGEDEVAALAAAIAQAWGKSMEAAN
jgi:DNA segregation ATPase FtsK/SpoIIIE, S-DNA-T family